MEHARRVTRGTMTVGRADDPAERQADRFADSVVADLAQRQQAVPGASLGRVPVAATAGGRVHRSNTGTDVLGGTAVDEEVERQIRSTSGGSALPATVRRSAERQSGRDLSGVRVHTGRHADQLSRSLHAEAFTSGSDIFMSGSAARAGTRAGDQLLSHEVGHVVQHGGGTTGVAQRTIQRRTELAPLTPDGDTTVRRFLGLSMKKSPKLKRSDPALLDIGQMEMREQAAAKEKGDADAAEAVRTDPMYLEALDGAGLAEGSLAKLRKKPEAWATAGPMLVDMIGVMQALIPAPERHPVWGPVRRRLRIAGDEAQFLVDQASVQDAKRKAGDRYMADGKAGKFEALRDSTRDNYFNDDQSRLGQDSQDRNARIDAAGKRLGLSKAEQTAITTFTSEDYKYINPATANSKSWMSKNRFETKSSIDKEKKASKSHADHREQQYMAPRMSEGSMHAGFADAGMAKLPAWSGEAYRGEALSKTDFLKRFKVKGTTATPRISTETRFAFSSCTTKVDKAESFMNMEGNKIQGRAGSGQDAYVVLWRYQLTHGRDLGELSHNPVEGEIATMPGATFALGSGRAHTMADGHAMQRFPGRVFIVDAKQIK